MSLEHGESSSRTLLSPVSLQAPAPPPPVMSNAPAAPPPPNIPAAPAGGPPVPFLPGSDGLSAPLAQGPPKPKPQQDERSALLRAIEMGEGMCVMNTCLFACNFPSSARFTSQWIMVHCPRLCLYYANKSCIAYYTVGRDLIA